MNLHEALAIALNKRNALKGHGRTDLTAEDVKSPDTNPVGDFDDFDYEARYGYLPPWKN